MGQVNTCVRILNLAPEVLQGGTYGFNYDWWGFGILLYEMLVGVPPFMDDNKQILYRKIVDEEPSFNFLGHDITTSDNAKDLIFQLLQKNPTERIKPRDIPLHKWFQEIKFGDVFLGKYKSPFVPKIKGLNDYSNFDKEFLNEECVSPVKKHKEVRDILELNSGKLLLN